MSIETINPKQLRQIQSNDQSVFILDVRTPAEYESVHAQGAVNVPLNELDPEKVLAGRKGSVDQPIYMICKMGGRSLKACQKFVAAGFSNVINVTGGTDGWVADQLPVVRGESKVMALDRQVRITAGSMVLVGALLGYFIHPGWIGISAFIGAGLVFSGVTDTCGMGTMLAMMPWNRAGKKKTEIQCDDGG